MRMDEYAYSIDFNDNRIIINNYFTSFREKRKINLLIVNKRDEVIKSISEDADRSLRELFRLANDNYYNIDLAMDTIIQALSKPL